MRSLWTAFLLHVVVCNPSAADSIRVPEDTKSIQQAIDLADSGDVILVSPGIYFERLSIRSKSVIVQGTDGPEATILDAGGIGPAVTIDSAPFGTAFRGFTVQNGYGAGISGAGIRCLASHAEISGNVVRQNDSEGFGGGILVADGATHVFDNVITQNASAGGGGIALRGPAIVEHNVVRNNTSSGGGGGILVYATIGPWIVRNTISNNHAPSGGGVYVWQSIAVIEENKVLDNTAEFEGGGCVVAGEGVDVWIERNTIARNTAVLGGGFCVDRGSAVIVGNLAARNVASYGACLYQIGGATDFSFNSAFDNSSDTSPAFHVEWSGVSKIANSVFWDHRTHAPQIGSSNNGTIHLRNSITPEGGKDPGVSQADPKVVAAGRGDYRPRLDSASVDAGTLDIGYLPATDLDGNSRTVGMIDIGAYEMQPEVAVRYGNIEGLSGDLWECIRVNGEIGDRRRVVDVSSTAGVTVEIGAPDAGPAPARFAIYVWQGQPDIATLRTQPFELGMMSFPTPLNDVPENQPIFLWNNLGRKGRLGFPDAHAMPAPTTLLSRDRPGLPGTTVTMQGFIQYSGAKAEEPIGITNAVVLRVE